MDTMSIASHSAPLRLVRIRMPDERRSWTIIDGAGETVGDLRHWIVHLEQTHCSPNTIRAYARHVVDLANYLTANESSLVRISVPLYDDFLRWRAGAVKGEIPSPKLVRFAPRGTTGLSPSTRNQIQLAVKSLYRFLSGRDAFEIDSRDELKVFDGHRTYKPFLEHINQRRTTRRKDRYLNGDLGRVTRRVHDHRLLPDQVLELVQACHLLRDAFLIVLLYNTGMRIGEALGLRHTDIDVKEKVVWVMPRDDNENEARAKSRRVRAIPVHDYVINMYVDYLISGEYLPAFESGSEYVFCNVKAGVRGRALSISYSKKLCSYLKRRTGVALHWHVFRHTHASEAIADGYSLLEVAERLGHASPQTTADFYRHLFSAEVRKLYLTGPQRVMERLDQIREAELMGRNFHWA